MKHKRSDIIIVGGGHAGLEAALIARHLGKTVLMVTMDVRAVGRMSCNPAIGGLAKGQMVREIDVLGGKMGVLADFAGIQFKTLNKKKGRAVWSPRAQVDKRAYENKQRHRFWHNWGGGHGGSGRLWKPLQARRLIRDYKAFLTFMCI